jgi:hypothetical protein
VYRKRYREVQGTVGRRIGVGVKRLGIVRRALGGLVGLGGVGARV